MTQVGEGGSCGCFDVGGDGRCCVECCFVTRCRLESEGGVGEFAGERAYWGHGFNCKEIELLCGEGNQI